MSSRIAIGALLFLPTFAYAQLIPANYPHSGLVATAGLPGIERGMPRQAGPRFEATGMPAPSAIEVFAFKIMNDPRGKVETQSSLIRRWKAPFQVASVNLGIPDVQDALFFTETRAVRVRLYLRAAGAPISESWSKQLKRYFDYLDRDKDGVLNAFEADFVFSNRSIQQMLQFGQASFNPNETGRSLADFDRDGDGRISLDEFAAYYFSSAASLVRVQPNLNRDAFADTLTDELFKLLDRDKDGKLSQQELTEAEKLLAVADQNEDECLAALELVPNLFNRGATGMMATRSPSPPQATPSNAALQFFAPNAVPDTIVEQLLTRYDKDKNYRLSKAESGYDDATFAKLDKNGNGELTITELMAWRDLPPDLEIDITLGSNRADGKIVVRPGPDGKPSPLANAIVSEDGRTLIRIGQQQIDLGAFGSGGGVYVAPRNNFQFEQGDRENKGYILEKDIAGPQFQFLRVLFDVVDRDGDGRMTRKEYNDYFDLQQSFASLPLALVHATQTPSLFALIDANGDGRLSVRELRNGWARLKSLEPGGGSFITRDALKPHASIRLTRGNQANQAFANANYNPNVTPTSKGPMWFRKMDRNNDGDISRSEFPGRDEDFAKLDTDQDRLISAEEAEAADKQFRADKK